jgi:hypothetical protein
MTDGFLAGLFGVAAAIVSLAVIATLVKNAGGTSQIIDSSAGGFASVLRAAQGN